MTMTGEISTTHAKAQANLDAFLEATARLASRHQYGTLILDRFGRIQCCGPAGGAIFGANPSELEGKQIHRYVADLMVAQSEAGDAAAVHTGLRAGGNWRTTVAWDVRGNTFAVELNLARVTTDGQDIVLLNLRRRIDAEEGAQAIALPKPEKKFPSAAIHLAAREDLAHA